MKTGRLGWPAYAYPPSRFAKLFDGYPLPEVVVYQYVYRRGANP